MGGFCTPLCGCRELSGGQAGTGISADARSRLRVLDCFGSPLPQAGEGIRGAVLTVSEDDLEVLEVFVVER